MEYKHSCSFVGANKKHIQIMPKYRYKMMRRDYIKVYCKVAIEEACNRHKIVIEIIKVMPEHVYMTADIPRIMSVKKHCKLSKGCPRISYFVYALICERDIQMDIFGLRVISVKVLERWIMTLLSLI